MMITQKEIETILICDNWYVIYMDNYPSKNYEIYGVGLIESFNFEHEYGDIEIKFKELFCVKDNKKYINFKNCYTFKNKDTFKKINYIDIINYLHN